MKILIWFLCTLGYALITTILKLNGISLGALPTAILFGLTLWLARKLCKLWDERKTDNSHAMPSNSAPIFKEGNSIRFCRICGCKLSNPQRICDLCGTTASKDKLVSFCEECEKWIPVDSKYCQYCGLKLINSTAEPSPISNQPNSPLFNNSYDNPLLKNYTFSFSPAESESPTNRDLKCSMPSTSNHTNTAHIETNKCEKHNAQKTNDDIITFSIKKPTKNTILIICISCAVVLAFIFGGRIISDIAFSKGYESGYVAGKIEFVEYAEKSLELSEDAENIYDLLQYYAYEEKSFSASERKEIAEEYVSLYKKITYYISGLSQKMK